MALPYLQSYNDPKIEKAYQRFLKGETQRAIAKALKIPPRTIARYCKKDGWLAERQARHVAAESPNVAAVAADATAPAANATAEHESRAASSETTCSPWSAKRGASPTRSRRRTRRRRNRIQFAR
jgi:uncharacterized protein YjcR